VDAVHDRVLADHGGKDGTLNRVQIGLALFRPPNHAHYGDPDAAELTAIYAHGLCQAHGYADGNKRVAWTVSRLFLADNGYRLRFVPVEAVHFMEQIASGKLGEPEIAAWFRARIMQAEP
jgi:death-on-curing protein